jgi:hypothetical protein
MLSPALLMIAAILPPAIDDWKRTGTEAAAPPLMAVAREYGHLESEAATYANGAKKFRIAVHRMRENTGAVALEQSLQGPEKKVFRHQNYVFETLEGTAPRGAMDAFLFPALKVDRSALPNLIYYLPRQGRVGGSERLILGRESLRAFEPRIPVAAAGFDFAAEIQMARYGGEVLAVIRYPNQAIARQQLAALEKVAGGMTARSGPLVSVALPAQEGGQLNGEVVRGLLGQIQYKGEVILDKAPPKPEPNPGDFLIGVFTLCAILLGLCLVLGLVFAFGRQIFGRVSGKKVEDEVTTLRI